MKVAEKVAVLQALLERVQRNAAARGAPGHAAPEGATPRDVAAAPSAAPERIEPIGRSRADSLPEAGWDTWADVAEAMGAVPPPPAVAAAQEVAAAIPVAPLVAPPPTETPPAAPLLETTELELAPGPPITFPESPASRRAAELQLGPLPTPPPDSPTPVPRAFPEPSSKARAPSPARAQPVVALPKTPAPAAVRKSPPQFWSEAGDRVSEPPADFERAIAHALESGQGKRVESVLPPPPSSEPAPLPDPEPASAPPDPEPTSTPRSERIASPSAPPAPTIVAEPEPDSGEDDDTTDQAPGAGPLSRRRARPRLRPARRPRSRAAGSVARVAKLALGGLVIASLVGGAFLLWSNRSRSETQSGEIPSAPSGPLWHEEPRPAPSAPSSAPSAQPPASAEVARPPAPAPVADAVNDRGALIVESPVPASVYVNGVLAGAANERLQVACGLRHVRLARPELPPPGQSFPMWTTDGISVLIACGGVTKAAIAPGGSAP